MAAAVLAVAATVGMEAIAVGSLAGALTTTVFAKAAFSAGLSLLAGSLSDSGRRESPSFTSEARSRTQMIRASTEPRRAIYGSAPVSGVLVFADSTGDSNKYLHLVVCMAGHQCQAINDIIFNDEVVGGYDVASGMFTTGRYAGKVRIRKHLGAVDQLPDADLNADSAKWAAKYRPLRGITYIAVRLEYDRDVFPTGIPNIRANVDGKNTIWDVRTGNYGWYNNAALCQLDYILWLYGMRCTVDEIDTASWIAAANISDEDVALPASAGGGTQKRYVCNGTFTLDRKPGDMLRELRSASAGALIYRMGKWYGYAGAADVATQTLNEDDLRGPVKIRTLRPKGELFNAVRGLFFNPDDHNQLTDFPPVKSAFYETQDGGGTVYKDVQYPFTDDVYAAQRLAKIELERHRQQITGTLPCKLKALRIVPWRPVKLNIGLLGFEEKLIRITNWRLTEDGGVDLDYEEYSAATWDWNAGEATTVDTAPNTALPSPWGNLDIADVSCASGTPQLFVAGDGTVVSRIEATWPAPANPYVSRYLLQYKAATGDAWIDAAPADHDAAEATQRGFVGPVQDGVNYLVRVRAETGIGNRGEWTESPAHTVIGKAAPPSDVAGLALTITNTGVVASWQHPTDPDLARTELSWSPTFSTIIDAKQATTHALGWLSAGTYTIYARHVDTSRNPSEVVESATITIAAPGTASFLQLNFGTSNIEATWTAPPVGSTQQPLDRAELSWSPSFANIIDAKRATTATFGWLSASNVTLYVRYVDAAGNIGDAVQASLDVLAPSVVTMTAVETQVNVVTLRWQSSKTSQPIKNYRYYIGEAGTPFESTSFYGSSGADSRSDLVFFRSSGDKVIYITAEDVAGNVSAPTQVLVTIKMPGNFVLATEYYSDWQSSEITNGTIIGGATGQIILPANNGRTWGQRLSANGWTTAQQKIAAGYPIVVQPVPASGKHVEQHDCGKVIAIAVVSATPSATVGASGATVTIRIRGSNGDTPSVWQPWLTGAAASISGFRYVEVEYSVTSDGKGFMVLDDLYVKVEISQVTEAGVLTLNAADAGGTPYTCTKSFLDVRGAVASPLGSANIARWNVIIDDAVSPAKVYVQAWDIANARTGGVVSLQISGV